MQHMQYNSYLTVQVQGQPNITGQRGKYVITRPGVAGDVLQSASLFIKSLSLFSHEVKKNLLQIYHSEIIYPC